MRIPTIHNLKLLRPSPSTRVNVQNRLRSVPGFVEGAEPRQGLVSEFKDTQVPVDTFVTNEFNLLAELPQVARITQIRVGGSGWSFHSRIDNVIIERVSLGGGGLIPGRGGSGGGGGGFVGLIGLEGLGNDSPGVILMPGALVSVAGGTSPEPSAHGAPGQILLSGATPDPNSFGFADELKGLVTFFPDSLPPADYPITAGGSGGGGGNTLEPEGPGVEIGRDNLFTADLALTKDVTLAATPLGLEATYTLIVAHKGPHSTAKVAVTDPLPGCLEFVSATAERGSYNGEVWTIGAVKVGETIALEIVTLVTDACTGEVTNEAWISRSTLPDPADPDVLFGPHATRENNRAEATFTVGGGRVVPLDGTRFELGRNYPNPFNPETTIRFSVPEASYVKLTLYDMLGRQVRVLVDGLREAGTHEVVIDASTLPSGTYLYRLETPAGSFVQTMQLVK